MNRFASVCITCLLTSSLTACSNFSAGNLFSHYSAQNRESYQQLRAGDYAASLDSLSDVGGPILDNFERGRLLLLQDNNAQARDTLFVSDKAVQEQQDKATISLSESAASLSGLLVNDNLKNYIPADYELGFLHLYLALTYIHGDDLDNALVEFRRANQVQERAKELRDKELRKEQATLEKDGIKPNLGAILARYPDAGKTLKAVQNGYLFYLSGLMFESSGDLNDAYVDYRRALAVAPDNATVAQSAMRCAQKLSMQQDLILLHKRYGKLNALTPGHGRVIVVQEQSVVNLLQDWKLSLPVLGGRSGLGLYSIALPFYSPEAPSAFAPLTLNHTAMDGDELADVNLMARQQLRERIVSIVTRQVVRLVLKNAIRREASRDNGILNLAFNVWNTLTEQPDTRSWLSLPANVYLSSRIVKSGTQTIIAGQREYQFTVPDQGTVFVWISRQGPNAVIWHKQLGKL